MPRTAYSDIVECNLCKNKTKHRRAIVLDNGQTVLVGRCILCDTAECKKCESRTLDPTSKKCRHCGHPIAVRAR